MRGIRRIKSAYHRIRNSFKSTGIILMYHRVVELESDPWGLAVNPEFFVQQINYLKKTCTPVSLEDLADVVQSNRLQKRSVCITFDDGYIDNLSFAYPILKNANMPATIFISSQYIDSNREYWWDELERIILVSKNVLKSLTMNINQDKYQWALDTAEQRSQAYGQLHKLLRKMSEIERRNNLDFLHDWAGYDDGTRNYYRPMNSTEIRQLAQDKLIEIGSHTMTHTPLNMLTFAEQYDEIKGAKECLERIIKSSVLTMAYPHGAFNADTLQAVRDIGIQVACTTKESFVEKGDDCLKLPRFGVGNWDLDTFIQRIELFFMHNS
jgi:peptidoglycan/xylan/chitin deacetylase (PgdA/CDA1 family)